MCRPRTASGRQCGAHQSVLPAHTVSSDRIAELVEFKATAYICYGLEHHEVGDMLFTWARYVVGPRFERGVVTLELFTSCFGPRSCVRAGQQGFSLRVGWFIGRCEFLAHGSDC